VVRIFNTYGPNMHPQDGRVVSNFIVQALGDQDLTVYGDGGQTRSFQYVDDLVEGMVRMMENGTGFVGPVNLGNPGEFTIRQLAEKVLAMIPQSRSRIVSMPLPADDPRQRKPDISLAYQELGWQPSIPLEQGLALTIDYFRQAIGPGTGPAT
jgi:UDP-glucuronate decarboxylase